MCPWSAPRGRMAPPVLVVLRVRRGLAVPVYHPRVRDLLMAVEGQAYLAGSHGACGHVQQDGAFQVAGDGNGQRVGAQPTVAAAEGGHCLRTLPGICGNQANHTGVGGHARVVAQPPDVALLVDGHGRYAVGLGLRNGHIHSPFRDNVTEAPVAVDSCRCWRLVLHLEGRAGDDMADADALGVDRHLDDPVRIVARQVGPHDVG